MHHGGVRLACVYGAGLEGPLEDANVEREGSLGDGEVPGKGVSARSTSAASSCRIAATIASATKIPPTTRPTPPSERL